MTEQHNFIVRPAVSEPGPPPVQPDLQPRMQRAFRIHMSVTAVLAVVALLAMVFAFGSRWHFLMLGLLAGYALAALLAGRFYRSVVDEYRGMLRDERQVSRRLSRSLSQRHQPDS